MDVIFWCSARQLHCSFHFHLVFPNNIQAFFDFLKLSFSLPHLVLLTFFASEFDYKNHGVPQPTYLQHSLSSIYNMITTISVIALLHLIHICLSNNRLFPGDS